MTRIKTVLGVVAVMAVMLVVFAAPAMADDWNSWDHSADSDWYDELCSPGLPDGFYVPGCIFSDADDFRFDDHDDFRFDDHHDWDDNDWDRKDWDRKDWDHDRDD